MLLLLFVNQSRFSNIRTMKQRQIHIPIFHPTLNYLSTVSYPSLNHLSTISYSFSNPMPMPIARGHGLNLIIILFFTEQSIHCKYCGDGGLGLCNTNETRTNSHAHLSPNSYDLLISQLFLTHPYTVPYASLTHLSTIFKPNSCPLLAVLD